MKGLLTTVLLLCVFACNTPSSKSNDFYESTGGFDFVEVPLIFPFKAMSIDNGENWRISGKMIKTSENVFGDIPTLGVGVSKNYIFGTTPRGNQIGSWFLLNTTTSLYVEYSSLVELQQAMQSLNLDFHEIKSCNEFLNDIHEDRMCYWYPPAGEFYPEYKDTLVDVPLVINISEFNGNIDFSISDEIKRNASKIYHFKVNYNRQDNALLYISINYSEPVLIQNDMIFPSVIDGDSLDINVYTPYPVAQKLGISEKDRILLKKTFVLKQ